MSQDLYPYPADATTGLTDAELRASAVPVSAASLPLPTGAATAAKQPALGTAGTSSADVISIQGVSGGTPVPVSGTFAVTGALTDTELRASAVPVSLASVPVHPVTDGGLSLTVDAPVGTPVFVRLSDGASAIATLPVSLASVPSHAVTNAGTFAVQADTELPTAAALADGASNPNTPTVGSAGMLWNGTTWDRRQGKETGTLLSNVARTTTTSLSGSPVTSRTAKGAIVYVTVTVAGTSTLQLNLCAKAPDGSGLVVGAVNITAAAGTYQATWALGASGTVLGVLLSLSQPLPKEWYIVMAKGDASSWTYGVTYELVP